MFTDAQIRRLSTRAHHATEGSGSGHTILDEYAHRGRYVVGGYVPSRILPIGTPIAAIRVALWAMCDLPGADNAHTMGYWEDGGAVYLDLGTMTPSLTYALKLARERGELAIYDRMTGECIRVSDTPGMHVA